MLSLSIYTLLLGFVSIVIILRIRSVNYGVTAFNMDIINYIRHEGQPDSMFGFSVALHQESQKSWVIVGAPEADTSSIQHNVRNGGAVYRCTGSDDNRCHIIPFDSHGDQYNEKNEQVDTKSGQWFGATVSSAGIDGPLVACAPRYVFHSLQPRKVKRVEPVGTCYLAKNNSQVFTEYSPCRTIFWGYHRQGSCQAGMSAALSKNGDRLFIGAPGSWYWQGQAYSINTDAVYPYKPPRYDQFGEGGQMYSFSLNNPRDKVWSTGESTAAEDDSYLGYSAATGDFNGDGLDDIAMGMPRGGGLLGKVLLFSWNMTNIQNITGEQIGSYFGYSLCVVDVDGDKLDDIIIGAPMHTEPNNEGKYEMGRVYIMFQDKFNKFQTLTTRDGINSRARFGLALASLRDVNLDGYGDFVVGAPYDGPNGRGAVYIYHGSANGPLEKYSQVIYAEDVVGTANLNTFGFSVSGGIDLDGNMYPDMVVGAYGSNKAIVFRARPVAVMEASTVFEAESKLISLDEKNCAIGRMNHTQVTCTVINSCLKYNGINLPATVDIEISWTLDTKKSRSPRLFFYYDEGKNVRNTTMRLYRSKTECRAERVYIADNIRDKLTPLEVEMKYNLRSYTTQQQQPVLTRTRRAVLEPILDMNLGTVKRDSINIQKNCGPDNICIPDLRLSVSTIDRYLLGSKEALTIEVKVANYGEDAFEAGFYMIFPVGLNFRKVEKIGDARDVPITCTAPSADTNHTLKCDIGNPLSSGKSANFKVVATPSQKYAMAPSFDFYMEANSTNAEVEDSYFDNIVRKSIGIWVETDLSVSGVAHDAEFHYNVSEYVSDFANATKEHEIGPHVVTIFEVRNGGPSTIEETEVFLLVPYETLAGEPLMYLLNQPEIAGNIKCEPTLFANSRNLIIDQLLERKSYLESYGAIDSAAYSGTRGISIEKDQRTPTIISGTSYVQTGTGSKTNYTEEERKRLDAEENVESIGDASFDHKQRQATHINQLSIGQPVSNRNNAQQHSYTMSWNSSTNSGSEPVVTYASSKNRTVFDYANGTANVVEHSTEHYGGRNEVNDLSTRYRSHNEFVSFGGVGDVASTAESAASRQNYSQSYYGSGTRNGLARKATYNYSQHSGNNDDRYGSNKYNTYTAGLLKVDDFPTEENVNQDLSNSAVGIGQGQSISGTGRRRMISQQDGEPLRTNLIADVTPIEKMAQGGRGVQVSTLDLGINRGNVGEEMNKHVGSKNNIIYRDGGANYDRANNAGTASRHYDHKNYSSGIGGGGAMIDHHTRQYSSASGTGNEGTSRYHSNNQDIHHHQNHHYSQSSGKMNTIATNANEYDETDYAEDVDEYYDGEEDSGQFTANKQQTAKSTEQKFKHYPRNKRQVTDFSDLELQQALRCNNTRCAVIRCTAGPLEKDTNAWISIRTRLVSATMHKVAPYFPFNSSTLVIARVSKLPYIGVPQEKPMQIHEVHVTAIPTPEPKSDAIPLWIIILAAVAGVLILLLLSYILYKCGFFKRNRPSDSQERQPLRNGVDHGDEHL